MGVEVVDSMLAHVSAETGGEENSSLKENGTINQAVGLHETIKFGSHGADDEPVKGEANKVSEAHFPKDAVDEWPAPKQVHSFFLVKYRSFEDQKVKSKLEEADKELHKRNQLRSQLIDKLRAQRSERAQVVSHIRAHAEEKRQHWMKMDEKKKEMEPLQQALGQLRGPNNGGRDGRSGLFSSEAELNEYIKSLHFRIQHESIPLTEEKQILREIKQVEATREQVAENAAARAKIQESMGKKETLQGQVKLIEGGRNEVWKEQLVVKAKLKQLEEEKLAIEKVIKSVEEELTAVTQKRDQTFENIQQLRKQREEGNSSFYENRSLLNKAKELAARKDVEALKDLSKTEVNKFISSWSSNKSFREDYERRILPSLDMRQLSRDGRMRNPDEKPLLAVEASTSVAAEVVQRTAVKHQDKNVKQEEEVLSPPQPDASSIQKGQTDKKQQKEATNKKKEAAAKSGEVEDEEDFYVPEKLQKDPPKANKADELKLKEMKKEEELAKAKLAMERKKKLAEKAAAKAELKKQKETEKKEKEREKRLKKKTGGSAATAPPGTEEQSEEAEEVTEPEKAEEASVEAQAPPKNKDRKENNTIKYRKRSKGPESLPRTILKRKKATNYWMWAPAPAALAVVLLLTVGYYYYLV